MKVQNARVSCCHFMNILATLSAAASQNQPFVSGIIVYFIYSTHLKEIIRFSSDYNNYLFVK